MSVVYFRETENRKEFVEKVLKLFEKDLEPAKSFLVKPNIVSAERYPTTTHPEVLDAVLNCLSGRDVIVADAPAFDAGRSDKVLSASPLKEICELHGVQLVNLHTTTTKKIRSERGYGLRVFIMPLKVDYVVSLPVLKVHGSVQMTGALKNQFGYLANLERLLMHACLKNINKGIAELNVVAKPDLFIMNGVDTLVKRQELRHGGIIRRLGYMLAGTDPVSLDCFGLGLLKHIEPALSKKEHKDILQIRYAYEYKVGALEYKKQKI